MVCLKSIGDLRMKSICEVLFMLNPAAMLRFGEKQCLLYHKKTARIGRSAECELVVNDLKVSRSHALIEWDERGFSIRDLGSSNGTFVNGQRIGLVRSRLQDGDQIQVHEQVILFEIIRADVSDPMSTKAIDRNTSTNQNKDPVLIVQSGPDQGKGYVLWGDQVTLGQTSNQIWCEIYLSDRSVSCPHARIKRSGADYFLIDLGSQSGIVVNGVYVTRISLKDGDLITLGNTVLLFHAPTI